MAISKEKRELVYNKYNGKCAYCGYEITYSKMQVDHIQPVFRKSTQEEISGYNRVKGTNDIDNLNPSCGSCNSSKSTFTIEQWRHELSLKVGRIRKTSSSFRISERFGMVMESNKDIMFHFENNIKI